MENANAEKQVKKPSLLVAMLPFVFLIGCMLVGTLKFEAPAQISLIVGIAFTALIGKSLGYSWGDIEKAMIETNKLGMQANFIMLIVGCLIGLWILGGVVPGLIYYGLKLFTPKVFLVVLPVMCAVISISIGARWHSSRVAGLDR